MIECPICHKLYENLRRHPSVHGFKAKEFNERFFPRYCKMCHEKIPYKGMYHQAKYCSKCGSRFVPGNAFIPRASRELSYVIGVLIGDGSVYFQKRKAYILQLRSKDRSFNEEFARCLGKLFKKKVKVIPYEQRGKRYWHTSISSKAFYSWWKTRRQQRWNIAIRFAGDFVRGFYDSEGSYDIGRHRVRIVNTNQQFQLALKRLFRQFKINAKLYKYAASNDNWKDCYCINLTGKNTDAFFKLIKFSSISRKNSRPDIR